MNVSKTKCMFVNCAGDLHIKGVSIEPVTQFKYLGLMLRVGLPGARRLELMALDRLHNSVAAYYTITSHGKSMGICNRVLRTKLVESHIVSHLLFGSSVWGTVLFSWRGNRDLLQITDAGHSARAKIEVHHRRALRWALGQCVTRDTRSAALYFLAQQIPVQGLALKQIIRYFGTLESSLLTATADSDPSMPLAETAHHPVPRWAATFLSSAE